MRVPLIGMGVAAVLVCGWLAILRYPPSQRMSIVTWLFIAFWIIMVGGTSLLRQRHSQSWERASAKILSCSRTYSGGHGQDYVCSYLYEVDGARQGGTLFAFNTNATLEQASAALVGRSITVKYNPDDCTQSQIDANSINGWNVQ
jgi:Protein of unknown function (DUF3592)